MSDIETGGPAFPYEERNGDGFPVRDFFGMTLRDYFAAKALCNRYTNSETSPEDVAKWAYQISDAMIKERSK